MSLKFAIPAILTRLGYRRVLVWNTVLIGLIIALFATIGPGTTALTIAVQAFFFGFCSSLQYTSMNTLVYADTTDQQSSSASSIASTMQQMSISFGVATAGLTTAFFVPAATRSASTDMIHGIHKALVALGLLTVVSTIVFRSLRQGDGNAVSQHKVLHDG